MEYFQHIEWLDSIDSTNKYVARSVRDGQTAVPALVVADRQTAGVGRGDHQWFSPSGCLMFSMAIPIESADEMRQSQTTQLPLRVGFAVAESVEPVVTVRPMIKWPNDVFLDGRKASGVLIEAVPFGNGYVAIIGVGINCRVDFSAAAEDVRAQAVSLHEVCKPDSVEATCTESVLVQFLHQWRAIEQRQAADPGWLANMWSQRSLLDQAWVEVRSAGGVTRGTCVGIDRYGAMLIEQPDGQVRTILSGTIETYRK